MSAVVLINPDTRLLQTITLAQRMSKIAPIVGPFHIFLSGEKKKEVIGAKWKTNPGWTDPKEINLRLRNAPDHFRGKQSTAYGYRTNGLSVLDFDGPEGMATYEKLKDELSPTLTIATQSGGLHLVYLYSGEETLKTDCSKATFPGTDIKCGDGILFGPGSWVEAGGEYSIVEDIPVVEVDSWVLDKYKETQKSAPAENLESGRNNTMISKVGAWIGMGLDTDDVLALAWEANAKFDTPLPESELTGLVRRACRRYPKGSLLQDWYLAKAIADRNKDRLRYCLEEKLFYVKGDTRWEPDPTYGLVTELINTARSEMIASVAKRPDKAEPLVKRLLNLGNVSRRKNVIDDLRRQRPIQISASEKDREQHIVGCRNGWIDCSGSKPVFNEGCPDAFVTKSLNAAFDPATECPVWNAALVVWFPNDDIRRFMRRFAGYILAGGNEREILAFLKGPAASGKTKFTSALLHVLGGYGVAIRIETITDRRRSAAGASEDLARLAGVRLAVTDEPARGMHFNEALVKSLAGGDRINARGLYQESFDFDSRLVLVIHSNFDLYASADDSGFWRRMLKVPFITKIRPKDRDPNLLNKLIAEADGILNWTIEGWTEYEKVGLKVPSKVRKASKIYRASNDVVGDFIKDCCSLDENNTAKPKNLYAAYKYWCKESGIKYPLKRRDFIENIGDRGFVPEDDGHGSPYIKGIGEVL